MKRLCFLAILLLIVSLISCSNNDDSLMGPVPSDRIQNESNSKAVSQSPDGSAILDNSDDDGDPWEDHRPDDGGSESHTGDTTSGPGDKDPVVPHDPGTGDQ